MDLHKLTSFLASPLAKGHAHHAFGLAISDTSLELVNMISGGEKLGINLFSRVVLEPNIIVRGYIRKADGFAAAIKELKKDLPKPADPITVVSAIPDYQVFTRLLSYDAKSYDKETIDDEIQSEMSKSLPLDFTEVVVRSNMYDVSKDRKEIMAFATHRSLVDNWVTHLKKNSITLAVLEMASLSLIRSMIKECPVGISYFLVDIGASSTDLAIFDCHGIKLSASMATGGRHFTEVIAKNLQLDLAQAEEQKCTVGLKGTGNSMVTPLLQKELDVITDKILKEIEYFERAGSKVEKIFLVGGSSAMPGIVPYFQEKTKRTTEQGHPWVNLHSDKVSSFALSSKKLPENQEHFYASATGLALRGLNRGKLKEGINFLS